MKYAILLHTLIVLSWLMRSCTSSDKQEPVSTGYVDMDQALEWMTKGETDSAYRYFSRAKEDFAEAKDSLHMAFCLIQMGIIQTGQADYFGGQETALQALDFLDPKDSAEWLYLSANYNNLGFATAQLRDYEQAIAFFDLAIHYAADPANKKIYLNNKAVTLFDAGQYREALAIYEQALAQEHGDRKYEARLLTNYANAKWRADSSYNPVPDLKQAMQIREAEQDLLGLNSSYSHLAEYYVEHDPALALFYAKKRYETAQQIHSAEDIIKALHLLIQLAPSHAVKDYYSTYHQLTDSIQEARSAARNQFAVIRYAVEKNKADNLRLQKDNAERRARLTRQRFMTVGFAGLFLFAVVGGLFWYKKRKQRLEMEAANAIKESELKTSRKVHDVVANGIYRVMSEIEYKEEIDREAILDKLESIYVKSRDISYEAEGRGQQAQQALTPAQELAELLTSFASGEHTVLIVGNEDAVWEQLDGRTLDEIRHVLQELMINMHKHSGASQVLVRFGCEAGHWKISYKDNGKGLENSNKRGNGLHNTVSRIKSLHGEIIFASEPGMGLKVDMKIPIP